MTARYDDIADWYVTWVGSSPGFICDPDTGLMPDRLTGERWLDVACGQGRTARELARRGASVVGIDISARQIAGARALEEVEPLGITYLAVDVARPEDWWDGGHFDGAVCEMAFMDIDDLAGTLAAVAAVLRPGGRFLASLVNPCFPGGGAGLSSWPPEEGYTAEGRWTSSAHDPDGARIRVGSSHRTLSTYLNSLIDAGLAMERVYEPPTPVPTFLVLACRRGLEEG